MKHRVKIFSHDTQNFIESMANKFLHEVDGEMVSFHLLHVEGADYFVGTLVYIPEKI